MPYKQDYRKRRPGCNPRTGEPLVPWQAVQKLDPESEPFASVTLNVKCLNEEFGALSRPLTFRVPPELEKPLKDLDSQDPRDKQTLTEMIRYMTKNLGLFFVSFG